MKKVAFVVIPLFLLLLVFGVKFLGNKAQSYVTDTFETLTNVVEREYNQLSKKRELLINRIQNLEISGQLINTTSTKVDSFQAFIMPINNDIQKMKATLLSSQNNHTRGGRNMDDASIYFKNGDFAKRLYSHVLFVRAHSEGCGVYYFGSDVNSFDEFEEQFSQVPSMVLSTLLTMHHADILEYENDYLEWLIQQNTLE